MDVVHRAGFRWLRLDCFDDGAPNLDRLVTRAVEARLEVLLIIHDLAAASIVASRYAALGVHAFELMNEPNLSITLAAYLEQLPVAIAAVREADTTATILAGSLAPGQGDQDPYLWGVALIDNGADFDVLSIHPYCAPFLPSEPADWSTWTKMERLHAYAPDVPIWATEFGGSIDDTPQGWTEARQVQAFKDAVAALGWLELLFWFCIRDGETGFGRYGVIREDGTTRPVLDAMSEAS